MPVAWSCPCSGRVRKWDSDVRASLFNGPKRLRSVIGGHMPDDNQLSKLRLVDADSHLDPPPEMWADYLPVALRELAPRIEHGEEHDWVVFEGRRKPVTMISNQAGRT